MQIVIDIPEETYEYWKEHCHEYVLSEAINNGTPLPKGHGRLIDADVVKEGIGNLDGFGVLGRCIDEMPTVIEADGAVTN